MDFLQTGKLLILFGIVLVISGVIIIFYPRIPFLGKLPGDILIKGKNYTFYFPLITSIIISIILTLLFNLFRSGK